MARLRDLLGGARGVRLETLGQRDDYWVLRATAASWPTPFLLKLAGPGCAFPVSFSRTAAVTRLARDAGIPAPHVVAYDDTNERGPWRWLVQEYAEGQEWRYVLPTFTPRDVERSYVQLAGVLVALRGIGFNCFGGLGPDGRPTSRLDWVSALEQRAMTTITDPRRRDAFVRLLHREVDLFPLDITASLCHDDLHHANVILLGGPGPGGISAVLDWDKAWAGHHESDLARMALWDDMTHPAFWAAYRDAFSAADGEDERRAIYQLLWCLEYDATTPRHLADTSRLAHQLGLDL